MPAAVNKTAFQKNAFQFNAFQIGQAQYRLLQPHYIGNRYIDQLSIITEGFEIPINWIPTLAVDPLNTPAVQAFWNAGPRVQDWNTFNEFGLENFISTPQVKPATYWVQNSPGVWTLTGLGVFMPAWRGT